jgi:hypothetical protein
MDTNGEGDIPIILPAQFVQNPLRPLLAALFLRDQFFQRLTAQPWKIDRGELQASVGTVSLQLDLCSLQREERELCGIPGLQHFCGLRDQRVQ